MIANDNMIGIGLITQADDSGELQLLQITQGAAGSGFMDRVLDGVPRVSTFGLSSSAPMNSIVVFTCRGGDRSNAIAMGTHHAASRPTGLEPGDTALYDVRGATIRMSAAGMTIDAAGMPIVIQNTSKVTIDAPEIEFTGNLKVAGTVTALASGTAVELGALRDTYNTHDHAGVSTGTAKTDAPGEQA